MYVMRSHPALALDANERREVRARADVRRPRSTTQPITDI